MAHVVSDRISQYRMPDHFGRWVNLSKTHYSCIKTISALIYQVRCRGGLLRNYYWWGRGWMIWGFMSIKYGNSLMIDHIWVSPYWHLIEFVCTPSPSNNIPNNIKYNNMLLNIYQDTLNTYCFLMNLVPKWVFTKFR